MAFIDQLQSLSWDSITRGIQQKNNSDVMRALSHAGAGSLDDLMALLSPAAEQHLEEMARISQELTLKRFGKTINQIGRAHV